MIFIGKLICDTWIASDVFLFWVQVLNVSLAALVSLMWLRKNKPRALIPIIYACAVILAIMPSITRSSSDPFLRALNKIFAYMLISIFNDFFKQ